MKQYRTLVVYYENEDKEKYIKEKIEIAQKYNEKYKYDTYSQYLTLQYDENVQFRHQFISVKYKPLSKAICGLQLSSVKFLNGNYSHEDINYAMSRIRGGPWEGKSL